MAENDANSLVLRNEVYQSNPLIQARKDFDMIGMRIFLMGLCGINPHLSENDKYYDVDFKEMLIPTSKLVELFGGNTWYLNNLERICEKIFQTIIKIRPADGGFELYHLFRKLKYVPREGLYLQFDELMRPYILDLFQSKGYTKLNVKYLFCLSSPYAVRLLELLLQYQNVKIFKAGKEIKRTLTVEVLRFVLNVPEGAYGDRIDNFRARVLDVSIKEINKRTPYIIRYTTIKEGRRVVAFEFIMDTFAVPKEDITDKTRFNNDAIDLLRSLGFTEKAARAIFAKCDNVPDCFSRVNRAQGLLNRQKAPVKNRLGFLRKAIIEGWEVGGKPAKGETPLPDWYDKDMSQKTRYLKIGKDKMPYSQAKTYIKALRKGEHLELINSGLKEYGLSIKDFEKLCKKKGLY